MKCIELDTTVSTNSVLLEHCQTGGALPLAVFADQQTGGRGRNGKSWYSEPNHSVNLSAAFHFADYPSYLTCIPLVAGLSILAVLQQYVPTGLAMKWPNDLYFGEQKCCGVLCESVPSQQGGVNVVIGCGLNTFLPQEKQEQYNAAPLSLMGLDIKPLDLARQILAQWQHDIEQLKQEGFESFLPRWQQADFLANRHIELINGPKQLAGQYIGIDSQGRLLLCDGNQEYVVLAGEVTVKF